MVETLVVGLDAATPAIINRLRSEDRLPALSSLANEGISGTLSSTLPPMTPQAWTSISTGTNPGRHGIFDFRTQDRSTYRISPIEYARMNEPTIWDVCAARDVSVGIMNYPLATPPPHVEEFFISGIPASVDDRIAYPADVGDYLDKIEYQIYPQSDPHENPANYFAELQSLMETRYEASVDLAQRYDPDVLWTVFMAIDWGQHYLWNTSISEEDAVPALYEHADDILGGYIDRFDPDTVLVLSDHGAQAIRGEIHLNSLLAHLDYLEPTTNDGNVFTRAGQWTASTAWNIGRELPHNVRERVKRYAPDGVLDDARVAADAAGQRMLHEDIEWGSTQAFTYGSMGRVFIHRADRYPEGTVSAAEYEPLRDHLIDDLKSVSDPRTGEPVFEAVVRAEEKYAGEYSDDGPNLLVVPRNWEYMIYGDLNDEWLHPPRQRIADHHPLGVFYAAGQSVATGEVTADITDFAPTLLYLLGLPILAGLDGEVVSGIRDSEANTPRPKYIKDAVHDRPDRTDEEAHERTVEERLDDLGYL